jgi:hypothetical protein
MKFACDNGLARDMSSDDEAPLVDAPSALASGTGDADEVPDSTPNLEDGGSGSDDGREVNFESDDEHEEQTKKARSGANEKRAKRSPGTPSKPSKRQNEEREARDEFVKRLVQEMHVAFQLDTKCRQERKPAFEMLKILPKVCEAIANPLLFNYWRDDPNHMNLLADWIAPQSRSINLPLLTKLIPAVEQLPLEKDVRSPCLHMCVGFGILANCVKLHSTGYRRLSQTRKESDQC